MQPASWRTKLWYRWKTLRNVPFRRKWLVGLDLEGNTYWEFRSRGSTALNGRMRRIVEYASKDMHYADYKGPPQWVQWLRNARPNPPTLAELQADLARQQRVRQLAAQADARWNSVPLKGSEKHAPALARDDSRTAWDGSQNEAQKERARMAQAQKEAAMLRTQAKQQEPQPQSQSSQPQPQPQPQNEPTTAAFAPKPRSGL